MNSLADKITGLITELDHPEKAKIRAAVNSLIALSAAAPEMTTLLEQALSEGRNKNRWATAYVLGHLPKPSGAAIRALLDGLDHGHPDIRWAIALLLIQIAKTEGSLINLLSALCSAGTANQRRMAIYCIRDLQLRDDASMQTLLSATRDAEVTVRVAAATSLKTRSDAGDAARRRLLEMFLYDDETRVRNASAITLAQLGSPSKDFIAALQSAENDSNAQLRKTATAALSLLLNVKK